MDIIKNIMYTPGILIRKSVFERELIKTEIKVDRIYPKIPLYNVPGFYFSKPTHIMENIYLGNVLNASNDEVLNNLNIGAIINITEEIPNYYGDMENYPTFYNEGIMYYTTRIKDINKGDITTDFEKIIKFMSDNNDKNILIHCFMGASRSVIVTMLYLIHFKKMTLINALDYIKDRRPNINPNSLFYDQIKKYYINNYQN